MSRTFCPLPWNFQAIRNNGDIRICCQANISTNRGLLTNDEGRIFNAGTDNLDKARNAQLMKEVRKAMIKGEWHATCQRCRQEEESGLDSRRQYEFRNWKLRMSDVEQGTKEDGTIEVDKFPVAYYDLRFGNKCNLSCRMCGPSDSSAWYEDHVALTGSTEYQDTHMKVQLEKKGTQWVDANKSYQWYLNDDFWKQLSEKDDGIKHIYMAGGEPMLIREHFRFLEKCVRKNISKNIILEYNTNLTILPDKVLDLWKSFKEVRVGASIDGYGDVFEFQRYPAKWQEVFKNLQKLDKQPRPIFSWLACTVTVYNVTHIPEFMLWKINESDFQRINSSKQKPILTIHMAHKPEHLNVRVLSDEKKAQIKSLFEEYKGKFREQWESDLAIKAEKILDRITNYMDGGSYFDQYNDQLVEYSHKLDSLRGESSEKFLP